MRILLVEDEHKISRYIKRGLEESGRVFVALAVIALLVVADAALGSASISADQAEAAALTTHSGSIMETELDNEDGSLVYSVEFEDGQEVKIDALTGDAFGIESNTD